MRHNLVDDAQPRLATTTAASGADAVITIAADANQFWVLDWIGYSYATTPTNGKLTIAIGGVTVYAVDITAAGPSHIDFHHPLYQEVLGRTMVITLTNGGGAKNLNVRYR